jgi:catalase
MNQDPKARPNPKVKVEFTGGETHQLAKEESEVLTTNLGVPIADNQNSLRVGARGPTLLEDFILREKITHFDHERIPERVVHARGSAAHGVFECYKPMSQFTSAHFLSEAGLLTPVFTRFSTVAGGAGSVDLPRDVRGFAVKFYTQEGNFDLVGNNIPVFFVQEAIKFPDLVHAVKMEADCGYPQNATAHDTFWDFVNHMPETMHMIMWAMSDRAIPRSYRMMEGFGVNTFRLVNQACESHFVKFHWRPKLGTASVLWDEAVKICGADQDFHRRDLFEAIEAGAFPEFELGFQIVDADLAADLPFDILDATKLIPEELVPLEIVGKMTLNRNPSNFFAETEQVAFCPSHLVPGLDFSDDPLLQGRLFSYLDTQLSRLGSPNFQQIPINRPRCPFANFQRDGHMQMLVPSGKANFEPNGLQPGGPRESAERGFSSYPASVEGPKIRLRSESFADHYSQARLFYRSVTPQERLHIQMALAFELGKLDSEKTRLGIVGHLLVVDEGLSHAVAQRLGITEKVERPKPAVEPVELELSPALRLYGKYRPTLEGRKVGILLGEEFPGDLMRELTAKVSKEKASFKTIGLRRGEATDANGERYGVDFALEAAPSVLFDAIVVLCGKAGEEELSSSPDFQAFVNDAFRHRKAIGFGGMSSIADTRPLPSEQGVFMLSGLETISSFIEAAGQGKLWSRNVGVPLHLNG